MTGSVLLLAPSRGLGGGIERYVSTIEGALDQRGVRHQRLDLTCAARPLGMMTRVRFIRDVTRALHASDDRMHVILAHRNLLPAIYPALHPATRPAAFDGATVIVHGCEVWSRGHRRGRRTLRHSKVRVVAASNYTAGALAPTCHASVLHPAVPADWYHTLVGAAGRARKAPDVIDVVTAFRLASWREKGLETILQAVRRVDDARVRLTVCGTGPVPAALATAVAPFPWCRVLPDLTDRALAEHLAAADLFVLGTRTRGGRGASGEGFGLVLLEAQLAGTPVVAPAYGGSVEAFQPGLTGLAPIDETPAALAAVLGDLVREDQRRIAMGHAAATWARSRYEPTAYNDQILRTLLGVTPEPARQRAAMSAGSRTRRWPARKSR